MSTGDIATTPVSSERLHSVARENLAFLWKYVRGLGVDDAEADDIMQEALLVLTRKLDIVQVGKERSFLIGCATRITQARWRSRQRYTELTEDIPSAASPADDQLGREALRLLQEFVASLSDKHQPVFVLYEIQEFSVPEISEMLALPIGTVSSRLRTGRSLYRKYIERLGATHTLCERQQGGNREAAI